jgi:hypothetical protein
MHESDTFSELRLDDLVADATKIQLPAPRTPRRVIDLTQAVPAQRVLVIPDTTVSLVDGFGDYGS